MDLPNYFLADLPDASTLTPQLITEACRTLKENRAKFLENKSTGEIVELVAKLSREWLDPSFHFRKLLLEKGPGITGFSRETLAAGLDSFFGEISSESLDALMMQDLGSSRRLDEFVATGPERNQNRTAIARGHELLGHVTGGVLPNPVLTHLILGLLVRSAQFVKCASGTSFIPRIFLHSLYQMQPKLGACIEIAEWKGGTASLESALLAETDCLTATGSDETLSELRRSVPGGVRFIFHGHKLSFAFVTREAAGRAGKYLPSIVQDIAAWDQLGCLSPHALYVETGGATSPDQFAELLARELAAREEIQPRGAVDTDTSASIMTRRMAYQVRASADPATRIWQSENSTAWTVVHDRTPGFQPSCLHRFIHVKPVDELTELLATLEPLRGKISTVGIAAAPVRLQELAPLFSRIGVGRICPVGKMQIPPFSWRHDGRPSLGDLVTWTDFESQP